MKDALHDKFIPMKEPASRLSDVITELENPDYDLNDNEYYAQMFEDYKRLLGELCTAHAFLLMEVTNEQV